jgi:EpsI family protein
MNGTTDVSIRPDVALVPRPRWDRVASGFYWLRVVLVCALLVGSGAVRSWQAGRVGAMLEVAKKPSFALKELPLILGSWRGADAILDPRIAQWAGASDAVFRRYVNQATGVAVELIVLYGPAAELFIHMPEVCYPGAGFTQSASPDRRVVASGGVEAPFRSLVFVKGQGADADIEEVYYSWRYHGRWTPELGTMKQFERIPGMYKVQMARRLTEQERRNVGNPCESLLEVLVPEIERRLAPAS